MQKEKKILQYSTVYNRATIDKIVMCRLVTLFSLLLHY